MQKIEQISSTVFYSITNDLSFTRCRSLEGAKNNLPMLILKLTSGSYEKEGYQNRINNFELFDKNGNALKEYSENEWIMINYKSTGNQSISKLEVHQKDYFSAEFVDPYDEMTRSEIFSTGKEGLRKAILFLRELSKFRSLKEYKLNIVNQRLNKEIEKLKLEIEELKKN